MEFLSKNVDDTKKFAREFLRSLAPPAAGGATVVGLSGNLGSGKTTFVQCVAEPLGVQGHVTSPTFVILKSYKLKTKNYKLLHHIDAYRLKSGEELQRLGFEALLADPHNLILIEWPERVADILPADHPTLSFEFVDEHTRKITTSSVIPAKAGSQR